MKTFLMLTVCMLLLQYTNAQQKENNNTVNSEVSVVQKGYYSIGNNAQQLSKKGTTQSDAIATTQKGYYAIGNNKQKPAKRSGYSSERPAVTKGYYAIGNNSKKLNQ